MVRFQTSEKVKRKIKARMNKKLYTSKSNPAMFLKNGLKLVPRS